MPAFKNKEEYEKWKAEKAKSNTVRFQEQKESKNIEVVCGKCGSKNIYNPEDKKDKCDRCGEWLYQFATASVSVPDKARTVMNCPYCREEISDKSSRCKHCAGEIMTCSKCAKTVGIKVEKQFVGLLRGGYKNEMICMSCGKSLGRHASSNPSMLAMVIGAIILLWWLFKRFSY